MRSLPLPFSRPLYSTEETRADGTKAKTHKHDLIRYLETNRLNTTGSCKRASSTCQKLAADAKVLF